MSKSRKIKILGIMVFILLYLLTRIPRIGTTIVNTDEVYWHDRSERFLNALKSRNYKETYQKYHPGVPLMWAYSVSSEIISLSTGMTTKDVFNYNNFEILHTVTQVLLMFWFLILSLFLIYLFYKATDNWWLSLLSVTALSIEPFYLGNARLIHHDVNISLCVIVGITLVHLYSIKKWKFTYLILASFFLALAALGKTLFVGAFVFCLFGGAFFTLLNRGLKKLLVYISVLTLYFVFFYALLFPAVIVNPRETLNRIIEESYEVGEEDGHKQIFFGVETRDPGPTYYPILLGVKTSPFMLTGFVVCLVVVLFDLVKKIRNKEKVSLKSTSLILFSTIFYIGYFAVITSFSKKVDRYVIPMYPLIAVVSMYGWYRFGSYNVKYKLQRLIPLSLFILTVGYPLYKLFPHYLMYVNPVIGDAKRSNEIVGQKLFGIGIFDLRDRIEREFGKTSSIGINDYGPLKSIYTKGKVYNVLVEHPNSFTLMILGPNKVFPDAIKKDPAIKFEYLDSIYINGLEFWRIYKKNY